MSVGAFNEGGWELEKWVRVLGMRENRVMNEGGQE